MRFDYLTLEEVLAIHANQIEIYGGSHGVRDIGAIEAAIARSKSGHYPDLIAEAAALWESLAQNHPFVDGNKRAGFACMVTFLRINGARFEPAQTETITFILDLYEAGRFSFEELEPWLREHVVLMEE